MALKTKTFSLDETIIKAAQKEVDQRNKQKIKNGDFTMNQAAGEAFILWIEQERMKRKPAKKPVPAEVKA